MPNVGGATVKALTELTTAEIGWVIAADGKAYPTSDAATAARTEAVAMFGSYEDLDGRIVCEAIQITDSPQEVSWGQAQEYVNHLPKVKGATWILPTVSEWESLFKGCAIKGDATERLNINIMKPINGFKNKFIATGFGWKNFWFWTSTEDGKTNAWIVGPDLITDPAYALFNNESKSWEYAVRGFLYWTWVK